jgi:hypothetical protein
VHCSQVFRSSVPSDLLPSSPGRCPSGTAQGKAAALDQGNGGSAPVAECHIEGAVRQILSAGTSEKARCRGRSTLRGDAMRDLAGRTASGRHRRIFKFGAAWRAVGHTRGHQSPDQARAMAAELAGWTSGKLPGQVTEQLASWPPGVPSAADQPPASG